jgi:hypothetical protein
MSQSSSTPEVCAVARASLEFGVSHPETPFSQGPSDRAGRVLDVDVDVDVVVVVDVDGRGRRRGV